MKGNYLGNNIVSLNLCFLVLTFNPILWQKSTSNLPNNKEFDQSSWICAIIWICLCFLFASSHSFFSWAMSLSHCSLFWDSLVKALYFTAPSWTQHCTQPQNKRYECVYTLQRVSMQMSLSSYTPNCWILLLFFLFYINFMFLVFNCFDMVEQLSVYDILQLSFAPSPNPHPYTACFLPLSLQRLEGLK